jgi:hypothetical protein
MSHQRSGRINSLSYMIHIPSLFHAVVFSVGNGKLLLSFFPLMCGDTRVKTAAAAAYIQSHSTGWGFFSLA